MTEQWRDQNYVRQWDRQDLLSSLLEFPQAVAAAIVASEGEPPGTVLDIGSGPGAFLAAFLDAFPDSRGVWSDVSAAMAELAAVRLARFDGRISFVLADMNDLTAGLVPPGLPGKVDVILSSPVNATIDKGTAVVTIQNDDSS